MCIAILKTPNGVLTKEQLQNCFKKNPDMCGFSFVNSSKDGVKFVDIWKGYRTFDSFYEDYKEVAKLNDRNIIIHFRIATSGGVNEHNCHPFRINNSLSLIHNGILNCVDVPKGSKDNDTRIFIDEYLKGLPNNIYKNKSFRTILGDMIGHNKFVLLDVEDRYYIINEELGHWKDGCWFSNYSYETVKPKTTNYSYKSDWEYRDYDDDYYDYYGWGRSKDNKEQTQLALLDKESEEAEVVRTCPSCGVELSDDEDFFCIDCYEMYKEMADETKVSLKDYHWCENCKCVVSPLEGVDNKKECPYCGNTETIDLSEYYSEV